MCFTVLLSNILSINVPHFVILRINLKSNDALNAENNLMPDKLAWDALPKVLPDENGNYPIAQPGKTNVLI